MNRVVLMGRLTKAPEVNQSSGGKAYARFNIAVERRFKNSGQNADFPSCIAFGKVAEIMEKYCSQGMRVCVEGRLQTGSYTNDKGVKVYTTDVVVENMEFAQDKNEETEFTDVAPEDEAGLPFN